MNVVRVFITRSIGNRIESLTDPKALTPPRRGLVGTEASPSKGSRAMPVGNGNAEVRSPDSRVGVSEAGWLQQGIGVHA